MHSIGQYCNWDKDPITNRANASCTGAPWRSFNYCYNPAKCNQLIPGSCPELSVFAGCFTNLTASTECTLNNGIYDTNELGNVYVCWLNGSTDVTSCRNNSLCDPTEQICQPFCYVTGETQANCDCSLYASGGVYFDICNDTANALTWNSAKGTGQCVISSDVYNGTSAGCASRSGTWYRGAFWQAASLDTQPACEAEGVCSAPWAATEAACSTAIACTVECIGCNATECLNTGACSDTMIAATGSCVLAPVSDTFGLPSCPSVSGMTFVLYPIGCVETSGVNSTVCAYLSNSTWTTRINDAAICGGIKRCRELRNTKFIFTQKSESLCTRCGGTYESIFRWSTGVPSTTIWTANQWRSRARASANAYRQLWNITAVQEAISTVFIARYAQLAKTYLACQYGSIASYLSLLTCDCTTATSGLSNCYKQFQPVLLGVTRICSGTNATSFLSPAELRASLSTVFVSGCASIELSLIPAGRFRRGSSNIYSSLFLDSIQTNEWAVIENGNQVVVGQLIGNGVVFSMDTIANPGIELCLEIRTDIAVPSIYTTFDFAVLSDDFEKFRTMYATDAQFKANSAGVLSVCLLISEGGNYFPIKRFANAKSAKFSDTLTRTQKMAFYAAVAVYITCWLFASYRLASLFLWTLIRPVDTSGQVKLQHTLIVPRIAMALLFFFFFLRWLYFILVPAGVMIKAPLIIDILMAELPTYFFITIFSLLVLWWVELYHRTSARKRFLGRMNWVFVGVNTVLYLFLLVVIIIYAVTEDNVRNFTQKKKSLRLCNSSPPCSLA